MKELVHLIDTTNNALENIYSEDLSISNFNSAKYYLLQKNIYYINLMKDKDIELSQSIFDLNPKQLSDLFQIKNLRNGYNKKILDDLGNIDGLLSKLKVDQINGLDNSNLHDMAMRIQIFGDNKSSEDQPKNFIGQFLNVFEDHIINFFIFAALLKIFINVRIQGWNQGWYEGTEILLGLLIYILIISGVNYIKEIKNFEFEKLIHSKYLSIKRNGKLKQLPISEIVVGDIIQVKVGEVLPVNGIIIKSQDLQVDQSEIFADSHVDCKLNNQPFIFCGAKVLKGQGLVLVLQVGITSDIKSKTEEISLKNQLNNLCDDIGYKGAKVALLNFTIMLIYFIYDLISNNFSFFSAQCVSEILNCLIMTAGTFFLSTPEGLPSAQTLYLNNFTNLMKNKQISFKDLVTCEMLGQINYIIVDITQISDNNDQQYEYFFDKCRSLNLKVIFVTEKSIDNKIFKITKQLGLVDTHFEYNSESLILMESSRLDDLIGELQFSQNQNNQVPKIQNLNNFQMIKQQLKVLTSSNNDVIEKLLVGLKQTGSCVAFIGTKIARLEHLKFADLRVSIESNDINSTKVCADVIIFDDSLSQLTSSIKLGRNLLYSIFKASTLFIQVDITVIIIMILGSCFFRQTNFTLIQMLQINLIMDLVAQLILIRKTSFYESINIDIFSKSNNLLQGSFWKKNFNSFIIQVCILIYLQYCTNKNNQNFQKQKVIFFHSFMLIQIINLMFGVDSFKSVQKLHKTFGFFGLMSTVSVLEITFIYFKGLIQPEAYLTLLDHIYCVFIAMITQFFGKKEDVKQKQD